MSLLVPKIPLFPDKHLPNEKVINVLDVAALGSEQK